MPKLPKSKFVLDAKAIRDAYKKVRPALAKDSLFIKDAKEFDVSLESLDARMAKPPASADGLWEWLEGADQYRYAGLCTLFEAFGRAEKKIEINGDVKVVGEARIVPADVHIKGDLTVDEQGMLMVLGSLIIDGNLYGDSFDYTLVAAHDIGFKNGVTGGELIAMNAIVASGDVYLANNDYSCRAKSMKAKTLVDFERGNAFRKVEAKKRISDWDFEKAAKALGVSDDDDLVSAFRKKLEP